MGLSPKQERFVSEYLIEPNATAAAIKAGYKEKTASQQGHNLLQNPEIKSAIKSAQKERAKRTQVTQDYVIEKLKKIADMKAGDYPGSGLRFGNQLKALELLGKHLGLFEPKTAATKRDAEDDPLTASLKEWMKENGAKGDI